MMNAESNKRHEESMNAIFLFHLYLALRTFKKSEEPPDREAAAGGSDDSEVRYSLHRNQLTVCAACPPTSLRQHFYAELRKRLRFPYGDLHLMRSAGRNS